MISIPMALNTRNVNLAEKRTLSTWQAGRNENEKNSHPALSKALLFDLDLPQAVLMRLFQVGVRRSVWMKMYHRSINQSITSIINTHLVTTQLHEVEVCELKPKYKVEVTKYEFYYPSRTIGDDDISLWT